MLLNTIIVDMSRVKSLLDDPCMFDLDRKKSLYCGSFLP